MSVPLPGPRSCLCWSFGFLTWRWFSGRLSPAWQENKHRYAVQCWQNCQSKLKYKKCILFHRLLVDKLHKHIHIRSLFCVSDMTQNLKICSAFNQCCVITLSSFPTQSAVERARLYAADTGGQQRTAAEMQNEARMWQDAWRPDLPFLNMKQLSHHINKANW